MNSWDLAEGPAGTAGASVKSSVGLTAAAVSEVDTSAAASSRLPLNLLNILPEQGGAGMGGERLLQVAGWEEARGS